jgi:hypothetical protein
VVVNGRVSPVVVHAANRGRGRSHRRTYRGRGGRVPYEGRGHLHGVPDVARGSVLWRLVLPREPMLSLRFGIRGITKAVDAARILEPSGESLQARRMRA